MSSNAKNPDLDAFLSTSSSTSLSDLDQDPAVSANNLTTAAHTIKKKRTKWHVYDTISKFLLKNRFYLTALEFYTELLENGYDLPRLREYFSNPANFEGTTSGSYPKQSSFIRNLTHYADDSVSLGGGGIQGDFLLRTSSSQTFDSTSIDNITRYSEDIDWNNGTSSAGAVNSGSGHGEQRFNDERVAVLEFELRKARDTIQELRQTLTFDSTVDDLQQLHHPIPLHKKNEIPLHSSNGNAPSIPAGLPVRPFERRTLNFLVNEYLLTTNYKLTSVTFGEENDTSDLEDWDSVGLNSPRPPDLTQLYRWYCHHISAVEDKPMKNDFSTMINFDQGFHEDFKQLKETLQQTVRLCFEVSSMNQLAVVFSFS